jgi:hypothetical protein
LTWTACWWVEVIMIDGSWNLHPCRSSQSRPGHASLAWTAGWRESI